MKISIDELKAFPGQKLNFPFNENLAGLDAVKPVLGDLSLIYSVSGIHLSGWVKTLLKLHCDRCLRPYFQALNVEIEERFVMQSLMYEDKETKDREPKELHGKDFVETVPDDGLLDIGDVVYQAVTLATPSYRRCGDECPGPPQSGQAVQSHAAVGGADINYRDKPIDPRWKNLKTLFPNEDSQQNS